MIEISAEQSTGSTGYWEMQVKGRVVFFSLLEKSSVEYKKNTTERNVRNDGVANFSLFCFVLF